MTENNGKHQKMGEIFRELPIWYYVFVLFMIILSLATLTRYTNGQWELLVGVREATFLILVLAFLPILLAFFKGYEEGEAKFGSFLSFYFRNKRKEIIDKQADKAEEQLYKSGRIAKDPQMAIEADKEFEKAIQLNEILIFRDAYLREFHELVKAFNENRHLPFTNERTYQGDRIAFRMRTLAPLVFGQFDVAQWLNSANPGKRLAAIKYLDWAKDIEFFQDLVKTILSEKPFIQFHIGLAIYSMTSQLTSEQRKILKIKFEEYNPSKNGSRDIWKERILEAIS